MGVVDDFSVVEGFIRGENDLNRAETGTEPRMVQEDAPGVGAHGGAFSNGHFQGLHGREPFDELLDAEPGDHEERKEEDGATGEQVLSESAAKNHPKEQDTELPKEANESTTRCGKNQCTDRNNRKETDKEPAFAADLSKHQRHQGERNVELGKTGKMVAIHVGPEGNAPKAHLAKPVKLSIKSEVLKDAEEGDEETKTHHEPDEITPVFDGAEDLRGQKEEEDIGKK